MTAEKLFKEKKKAIVKINVIYSNSTTENSTTENSTTKNSTTENGTGWFYKRNNNIYIITNSHVIFDDSKPINKIDYKINYSIYANIDNFNNTGLSKIVPIKVVGVDASSDIAVCKIDDKYTLKKDTIKTLTFSNSRKETDGAECWTMGYAFGDNYKSVTVGNIRDGKFMDSVGEFIGELITCNLNTVSGMSGSPIMNNKGKVIGLVSAAYNTNDASGFTAGIASKMMEPIVNNIIDHKRCDLSLKYGYCVYSKPFLDIKFKSVTSDYLIEKFNDYLDDVYVSGIYVTEIGDNSVLNNTCCGETILVDDIILEIENFEWKNGDKKEDEFLKLGIVTGHVSLGYALWGYNPVDKPCVRFKFLRKVDKKIKIYCSRFKLDKSYSNETVSSSSNYNNQSSISDLEKFNLSSDYTIPNIFNTPEQVDIIKYSNNFVKVKYKHNIIELGKDINVIKSIDNYTITYEQTQQNSINYISTSGSIITNYITSIIKYKLQFYLNNKNEFYKYEKYKYDSNNNSIKSTIYFSIEKFMDSNENRGVYIPEKLIIYNNYSFKKYPDIVLKFPENLITLRTNNVYDDEYELFLDELFLDELFNTEDVSPMRYLTYDDFIDIKSIDNLRYINFRQNKYYLLIEDVENSKQLESIYIYKNNSNLSDFNLSDFNILYLLNIEGAENYYYYYNLYNYGMKIYPNKILIGNIKEITGNIKGEVSTIDGILISNIYYKNNLNTIYFILKELDNNISLYTVNKKYSNNTYEYKINTINITNKLDSLYEITDINIIYNYEGTYMVDNDYEGTYMVDNDYDYEITLKDLNDYNNEINVTIDNPFN